MRLDFNETNILLQAISELGKVSQARITVARLLEFLDFLLINTDTGYIFICESVRSLTKKLEGLSDEGVQRILADKSQNKIIATTCYTLPTI